MDVIIETQKGNSFTIEIGYFDSVFEIKEKIEKYKEIPISQQTLVFNGNVLNDNGDVQSCIILDNSRLQLIVNPSYYSEKNPEKFKVDEEEQKQQLSPAISAKTRLLFKLQNHQQFSVDVDLNDSVEQLKEKLHEIDGYPVNRLALYVNGNHELQDHRHLREYELTDGSEIEVSIRPPSTPTGSGMTNHVPTMTVKKLKVVVLTKCGTKKIILEVNPTDKVQVLRSELEKWQQRVNYQLPPEGYFFIYKQNVMEERETFQWHNVHSGNFIEMFNGSVSGGS
ncbi:hypothetical protein RND81_09G046200 [Saponaria officinalis]|uniref:Ubiquitin-like domain-containing protein n=1 Tax=Saponaria officinalis TaxID=3572 RepID=A0AAW1II02_SAPOF